MTEKEVSYHTINTYSTLNSVTPGTRNIWIVFHGIGYLSRYFLRNFVHLDKDENYLIAPQAPSKYYLDAKYEHVGASWATRENTQLEMQNIFNYLDGIYEAEKLDEARNLILFGYSQGVSVLSRWMAKRRMDPAQLILHSGRVPQELNPDDFGHLKKAKVTYIYGKSDPFLEEKWFRNEKSRIKKLFQSDLQFLPFEGGHEVSRDIIAKLV